ncbi:hypothetical protein ACFSQ7_50625 [Paenibacillus rhizoplanae]
MSTLGKSEYGLFALVNSIIAYIVLLDLGFGSAVIRFNAKYISENDSAGQRNINGMFLLLFLSHRTPLLTCQCDSGI